MISEVECDTEDWSNNTENSAFFHHSDKLHCILMYFGFKKKLALAIIRVFFQKHKNILSTLSMVMYKITYRTFSF